MRGIRFVPSPPLSPPALSRMDVACFVGYTPLREPGIVPKSIKEWWKQQGWLRAKDIGSIEGALEAGLPVPVESWEAFDAVFLSTRLDRVAAVRSDPLPPILTVKGDDRLLHVLVDGHQVPPLTIQTPGPISRGKLVEQINKHFADISRETGVDVGVHALIASSDDALVLTRTNESATGELTVYRNDSLGFPHSRQQDVVSMDNYLSVAVREFFEHGGRRCYVVRVGDPLPVAASRTEKIPRLGRLISGSDRSHELEGVLAPAENGEVTAAHKVRLSSLRLSPGSGGVRQPNGLSYLTALPDVTYVCLPDLVDLVSEEAVAVPKAPAPVVPEVFAPCSVDEAVQPWFYTQALAHPVSDEHGYAMWRSLATTVSHFLQTHAPLVQFVASLPIPARSMSRDFARFVTADLLPGGPADDADGIKDPFNRVQLAFPWLQTDRSGGLPGQLTPPEGVLVGMLANGAITRGAYRSLAGTIVPSVYGVLPREVNPFDSAWDEGLAPADRVSWFEFVPRGIELSSDVTAAHGTTYRYAVVRRIMILVQRAAYELGLSRVFDVNSNRTWRAVERRLGEVLSVIYQKNGLRGRTSSDAFAVTCDRSTMSQNDLDNGRLIANVTLRPAVPVEQVDVELMLERDGDVIVGSTV